jgi:hypothetical protein
MPLNKRILLFSKVFFSLILLQFLIPQCILAQELKKVAVLPFEIYSKEDRSYLQEQIYNGILAELIKTGYAQIIKKMSSQR